MRYSREEKLRLMELIQKSGLPIKKACKQFGISDASYYTWRKQLALNKSSSDQTPQKAESKTEAEKMLLTLKEEHPYYGVVKLTKQLQRTHGLRLTPGKAKRVLEENGYEIEKLPPAPRKGSRRFERVEPKDLWMMDVMYYRLKKEGRFYLVSILDDYSRYIVAHRVFTAQNASNINLVLRDAVEKYGLPRQLLTDRGGQFYSWSGITAFQELLGNLGVEHILTRPQSPNTIGKIESFHRNIQKELLRRKHFSTIKETAEAIEKYIEYYNYERVHMGIGYLVPADRFFNASKEVEKAIHLPEQQDPLDFYLAGKIKGQPLRATKDRSGQVKIYLAGQEIKIFENTEKLEKTLLPQ